jgi:hypothetical protein
MLHNLQTDAEVTTRSGVAGLSRGNISRVACYIINNLLKVRIAPMLTFGEDVVLCVAPSHDKNAALATARERLSKSRCSP